MVRQNPANKGVIAKIVFLKGLWLKAKPRRWPGLFSIYSLILSNRVKLKCQFWGFIFRRAGD